MSNLNEFLVELQCGCFCTQAGTEVNFCDFSDSAFNLGLQAIQSYYRKFNRGAELNWPRARCNKAMRLVWIAIKTNYGMVSNLFCICYTTEGSKILKRNPVVLEQLRVCHRLINCYVCLNGDQAGSVNMFNLSPPLLEDYLRL
jgi:hypothetical protein